MGVIGRRRGCGVGFDGRVRLTRGWPARRRGHLRNDSAVAGFNVGTNAEAEAGQTVIHCHIHVIPRRKGDVADPRGGVRHTIPDKGSYHRADEQ